MNIFGDFLAWFHAWFDPLKEYFFLAEFWLVFLIVLVLALLAGYFANFPYVRAVLGFIALVFGAVAVGATAMFRHMRKELKK